MFIPKFDQPSVMKHSFSTIPHADIPRSSFKRSHGYKTTFNEGYLIPIYVDEALPGDTFHLNLSSVSRLTTPLLPFMDNLHMDFHFFAVPNRLLWTNWQRFMGERDPDPDSSIDYVVPQVETAAGGFTELSLSDYFGLPIGIHPLSVNALHHRAYNLIWNEWFRDQNLQDSVVVDKDDGPDDITDYVLLKRGKRHDYFTSCLPWPQKGDAIDLPLGDTAPVITGDDRTFVAAETNFRMWDPTDGTFSAATGELAVRGGTGDVSIDTTDQPGNNEYAVPANLWADLTNATAATINSLREAFQLQRLLERDARGGTRYTEIIQSHFRVTSPDSRLQRPEYLGGGSKRVTVEPVPTLSTGWGGENVGELGGVGYCNQSGVGFTKSFVEHCVLIGLVSVRADLTYQRGINRMFSRSTKYDYYWPALAHLGEQAVYNREIYAEPDDQDTGATGTYDNDRVFGYQERWADYRYYPSLITGALRSDAAASLDVWHLSQDFGVTAPALNSDFIEENPPVDRVVVDTEDPHFVFDGFFDVTTTRPMPLYSVPGLIDHF